MAKQKPLQTAFTDHFNIDYPIIAAPMFLVSTEKLVTAVGKSGALGTFPALNFRPMEKYREVIRAIKAASDAPFGINIIVQKSNKYQHEHLDIALQEDVPLIITSLGNPKKTIELAHQSQARVYCDVVGIEHAKKVSDLGADGLIAVASGAGGHAGNLSALVLIPQLVGAFKIPVIAAGSIVDGAGMAAALALGASAIYMGTRFIASQEAEVSPEYKQAILQACAEDIFNTHKVDGFPGNFIRTASLEKIALDSGLWEDIISHSKRIKRWLALSRAARSLLAKENSKVSYKTVYSAGHGSALIDEILPVEEIIQRTLRCYREIKNNLP